MHSQSLAGSLDPVPSTASVCGSATSTVPFSMLAIGYAADIGETHFARNCCPSLSCIGVWVGVYVSLDYAVVWKRGAGSVWKDRGGFSLVTLLADPRKTWPNAASKCGVRSEAQSAARRGWSCR